MAIRTSSTVRRSETARTRSRGAVPKTSPVIRYSVPGRARPDHVAGDAGLRDQGDPGPLLGRQ